MSPAQPKLQPVTRLYVPDDLATGGAVTLSEAQAHQLRHVLRLASGAIVTLFNGRDGEFLAALQVEKRRIVAQVMGCLRAQDQPEDIWLCFAAIRQDRMGFLVEKATELGAAALLPVITARTQGSRVNSDRLAETAREAAEQCQRLTVPPVATAQPLATLLQTWPPKRRLFLCAEAGEAQPALPAFTAHAGPAALLIGPEGGFTPDEFTTLRAAPFITPVTLGPLILRAETATIAALALWQAATGE